MARPAYRNVTVVPESAIGDLRERELFELAVQIRLPTANEYGKMGLTDKLRLRREVQTELCRAFGEHLIRLTPEGRKYGKKFQVTWRVPTRCTFCTRAICTPQIYRTDRHQTDPHNYVYPLDKLVIDALTMQKGSKWRGFGLLPDDSDEWLYLVRPEVHYAAPQNLVLLQFWLNALPAGLEKKRASTGAGP